MARGHDPPGAPGLHALRDRRLPEAPVRDQARRLRAARRARDGRARHREQQVPRPPHRRGVLRLDDGGGPPRHHEQHARLRLGSGLGVVGPERPRAVLSRDSCGSSSTGPRGRCCSRCSRACSGCAAASSGLRRRLALARQRLQGPALARRRRRADADRQPRRIRVLQHERPQRRTRRPTRSPHGRPSTSGSTSGSRMRPRRAVFATRMHVELYPAERRSGDRGHVPAREPRPTGAIDSLHVLPSMAGRDAGGALRPRRAAGGRTTRSLRYRIYALERPLAPGDSIAMTFELVASAARLPQRRRADRRHAERRVHLRHLDAGPGLLAWPRGDRREEAPRARPPAPRGGAERGGRGDAARGRSRCSWWTSRRSSAPIRARRPSRPGRSCANGPRTGRRYFHYRTDQPIRFGGAVLSAEYAVRRDTAQGVALAVYYHPTHDVNVDRMIRSMRASLAYYRRAVRPVPVQASCASSSSRATRRAPGRIRTRSRSRRAARS